MLSPSELLRVATGNELTVTVVEALFVPNAPAVITTVNISPFTAPVTVGLGIVFELKIAEPFVVHTHVRASPPDSDRLISLPAHTGLEFDTATTGWENKSWEMNNIIPIISEKPAFLKPLFIPEFDLIPDIMFPYI
jgi:hypothetical protein